MPITIDKPAPYAPARLILEVITRYREKGLPSPINEDVLRRIGVTESLMSRTMQALQGLDLIDEKGTPTAVFESLKLAPEADYKSRLAQWLTATYAEILKYLDPATASESDITDAFRFYNPSGMRDRMVTLFMALFSEAGIGQAKSRSKTGRVPKPNGGQVTTKRVTQKPEASPPITQSFDDSSHANGESALAGATDKRSAHHGKQSFEHLLLDKYPEFDPSWDDALKTKWFEGFAKFMALMSSK